MVSGRNESNQIVHILIEEKNVYVYINMMANVKSYREADTDSDHLVVGITLVSKG